MTLIPSLRRQRWVIFEFETSLGNRVNSNLKFKKNILLGSVIELCRTCIRTCPQSTHTNFLGLHR